MANEAARPKIRAQIHPRALAIIDRVEKIPEGWNPDGTPKFRGISTAAWVALQERPKEFAELRAILESDFPTYCALLLKVFYKRAGRIAPFIFNLGQIIAWNRMSDRLARGLTLFLVFLKARQLGISTLVAAFQHWQVWRLEDIECSMVGHEKTLVYSFMDRLRTFHEELPDVPGIRRELRVLHQKARVPKDELYYSDRRTKITTVVAKNVESRGRSSAHVLLSELAFYPDPESLMQALLPQLPPVGSEARKQCSVIVESTPNGNNFFRQLWDEAKREDTEWMPIFLPWMVQEDEYSLPLPKGYRFTNEMIKEQERLSHIRKQIDGKSVTREQMYWREFTLESDYQGDQDRFDMEYPSDDDTCFLIKSKSIFKSHMRFLQACVVAAEKNAPKEFRKRDMVCKGNYLAGRFNYDRLPSIFEPTSHKQRRLRPEFVQDKYGHVRVWSPPQPGHVYTIGMDIANGIGGRDWQVAHVADITSARQVAELRCQIEPDEFTDDCVALGYWYNTALLYPEINGIGTMVMKRIVSQWFYPNVGREEKWDEPGPKANKYGFYTSDDKKDMLITHMYSLIKEHHYAIASGELLDECSVFMQTESGSFEADGAMHDDTVIACALALYAARQSPKIAHLLRDKRHDIPTAADLGLSHAPTFDEIEERLLPQPVKDLLQNETWAIPLNPISGHDRMEQYF